MSESTPWMGLATALDKPSWGELSSLELQCWAWLDMALTVTPDGRTTERGFHVGTLPSGQPSQITHAWGWSTTTLARVRFDPDLPGGMAGALLDLTTSGPGSVPVRRYDAELWPADEGRTSMLIPSMLSGRELVNIYEVIVNGQPIQFIALSGGGL